MRGLRSTVGPRSWPWGLLGSGAQGLRSRGSSAPLLSSCPSSPRCQSIVNEVAKAVVANYNASELLTRRAGVAREIEDELRRRALGFNLVMEDVSITHLSFSPAYEQAVEAKQVAQQESQRAKFIVDKALQEKKSIIIRASGEAQSAKLIGNSIKNNPGFIQLRRIEAAKEIAETVNKAPNKMYLSSDSLMLNVMGSDDQYANMGKKR